MGLQESLKDHSNQGPVVLVYNQKILEYEFISKTYYLYAMNIIHNYYEIILKIRLL